jgi:hypothetical protein
MRQYPGHRRKEIEACIEKAINFIESIQLADGSWFVFSFQLYINPRLIYLIYIAKYLSRRVEVEKRREIVIINK